MGKINSSMGASTGQTMSDEERLKAAMGITLSKPPELKVASPGQPHYLGFQYAQYVLSFQKGKDDSEYQRSWIKRGGKVAFANLNRKMERLDNLVQVRGQDLFQALQNASVADAFLDTLAYLLMHVGETQDTEIYVGQVSYSNMMIQGDYGPAWRITGGVGAYADITRKIDSLQIFAKEHGFDLAGQLSVDNPKARERVRDLVGYLMLAMGRYLADDPTRCPEPMFELLTESNFKDWIGGGPKGGAQGPA